MAHAPGGPVHVLLSDEVAEHIPGCNMAYRLDRLRAIGGFDPRFRIAGDDVDICWRLQERGWTLGFSPAAVVWHHRRTIYPRLLEATERVCASGGFARRKMAAKIQRSRPPNLERQALRKGYRRFFSESFKDLSRDLG